MKRILLLAVFVLGYGRFARAQDPTYPNFVDNNEGICLLSLPAANCYPGSPALTTPYTKPTHTLTLTPGGGAWTPSQPPCAQHPGTYYDSFAGAQAAINDVEYCRTNAGIGTILKIPPAASSETATGCDSGAYCGSTAVNAYGGVIPQTSSTVATLTLVVESTDDAQLAAMNMPVCDGGLVDNTPEVPTGTRPRISNPNCDGSNMSYELGPSNNQGVISGITTVAVNTVLWGAVTSTGFQCIPLRDGYVSSTLVPTTTASNNSCSSGSLSIDTGGNQECVQSVQPAPGSQINQDGFCGTFLKTHSYPATATYTPDDGAGSGSFQLANGVATNVSAYNYAQYMPRFECNFSTCLPLEFCVGAGIPNANVSCAGTIGPSNWTFLDLIISLCPGWIGTTQNLSSCPAAKNDQYLLSTGAAVPLNATSTCTTPPFAQSCYVQAGYASHDHFQRMWLPADWTSLHTGTNSIADNVDLSGCYYCSFGFSKTSRSLRPGAEGHGCLADGNSFKIYDNVFEGQSSGCLSGGFDKAPLWIAYNSTTDLELDHYVSTNPYSWVGFACSNNPSSLPTNGGAACGNIPSTNPYWGGAQTTIVNVASDGITVTYVSGDHFHDSTSSWSVGHQKVVVNGTNDTIGSVGAGTCVWPLGTGCPTSIVLQTVLAACSGTGCTGVTFVFNSDSLVFKNRLELKEGQRMVLSGILVENVDNSGGQNGISFANAIRSISGISLGAAYNTTMTDLHINGFLSRNHCDGFADNGGRSAGSGSGDGVSYAQANFAWVDSLGYNISNTNPGCGSSSYGMTQAAAGQFFNATIQENAGGTAATLTAIASVDMGIQCNQASTAAGGNTTYTCVNSTTAANALLCGSSSGANVFIYGFTNAGNNAPTTGFPCVSSTSTTLVLTNAGGIAETISTPAQNNANPILNNTSTACSGAQVSTSCPAVGFQMLDMLAGDPAAVLGVSAYSPTISGANCTVFALPTQTVGSHTIPAGVGPSLTSGVAPWNGTWSTSNVQITYPWTAAGNASDLTGYCVLSNTQGSPRNVTHKRELLISTALETIGNQPAPTPFGPPFITNFSISNSTFLSAGVPYTLANGAVTTPLASSSPTALYNSSTNLPHEGQVTLLFNYDETSASLFNAAWPGRAAQFTQGGHAGCYLEVGNNPYYPDPNGCTGSGCTPTCGCTSTGGTLPGMFFPAAPCPGSTATSTCLGLAAAMNATSVPLTVPDYHSYEPVASSSYSADMVSISNIDTALTANIYVCPTACAGPGPFPDSLTVTPNPPPVAPHGVMLSLENGAHNPFIRHNGFIEKGAK
jgi:hypothetical protein